MSDLDPTADTEEQTEAPAAQGWRIDSEDKAAYAVDRILSRRDDLARVKAAAAAAIARAEKNLAGAEDFFLPQLADWLLEHPPAKGSTLHLVTGSISARKVPEAVKIVDDKALTAWAKEHAPGLVLTTTTVSERVPHSAIVGHLATTPAPLPGVAVIPETIKFDVKGPKR